MNHFPESLSQKIVEGILKGYKSYLDERREKKALMKISSAYAWVRGNHIDNAVAEVCETLGIEYRTSKAGYTWGYLKFDNQINGEKTLFILKIGTIINNGAAGILQKKKEDQEKNYLVQLSKINKKHFKDTGGSVGGTEQLKFALSPLDQKNSEDREVLAEVASMEENYTHFYIVTYEFDVTSKMLSSVNLFLPAPGLLEFKRVDNWNRFINASSVQITSEDLKTLHEDKMAPEEFSAGDYIVGKVHQEMDGKIEDKK
ncbi:hypothetical protein [Bacillus pumilus]|uniref:spr1630 family ClpXP-sensitive toxin n=1 Tax=Bacillus pumilus TaxID=1408 RepID=UPI002416495F|nr:hypothetical protein [Bacillus pumilus]WFO45982.1 hypothetical protein MK860_10355 [Bacillus pumilus]